MKNIALAFLLLCCSAVCLRAETVPSPDSRELAMKVADYVMRDSLGDRDFKQFFANGEFFHVAVHSDSGVRTLSIERHLTTWDSTDLISPAEMLGRILMFGRPETFIWTTVWDHDVNGIINGYQEHTKSDGPGLTGFTREERDRGRKAGIQTYLYDEGKIIHSHRSWFPPFKIKRQWQAATVAEQLSLQEEYFEMLQTIAKHYGIQ